MNPKTGRCAILLPHGVLFRDEEKHIRKALIEKDLVEAVIGLAPNLFYNSPMEACVMICRSRKSAKAKGRVLFINAVGEVTRKNAESRLSPEHINKILEAYRARQSDGVFAYDASTEEIAALARQTDEKAKADAWELAGSNENRKAVLRAKAESRAEQAVSLIVERIVNS